MHETYRGYELYTTWNDEALGFDYSVWSSEKERVACSSEAYFYEENAMKEAKEENAMKEAKEEVDMLLKPAEEHTSENGEDTEHVEDVIL